MLGKTSACSYSVFNIHDKVSWCYGRNLALNRLIIRCICDFLQGCLVWYLTQSLINRGIFSVGLKIILDLTAEAKLGWNAVLSNTSPRG